MNQLVWRIEFVLPKRRPDEKTGQYRLANIHRIHHTAKTGVGQSDPRDDPQLWFVPSNQVGGGLSIASPRMKGGKLSPRVKAAQSARLGAKVLVSC